MGLLRKAAGAVPDTNLSASAALASASSEPILRPVTPGAAKASPRHGLLKRSIQILTTFKAASPGAAPAESEENEVTSRKIIEESKALRDGVELPSRLFTTLRKRLSIAKGALLLYDPVRLEYAPWASHGFDQTTLHRMRIPLGANETFNALANGDPLAVTSSEQLTPFQRFFSSREFSFLQQMILCPYIFEDTLVGVLLITEIHHPFSDTAGLLSCLKDVASDVSPLLQRARGFLMKLSQAKATRPPAAPDELVARIVGSPAVQGKKMLFLSLAVAPYIREIAAAHEDIDLFRLREDVKSLLDAFLADCGVAVMLPAGALMVCLQEVPRDDIPLFLHQLRYFLGTHFAGPALEEKASMIEVLKSRVWPDEGTDVRELIAFLSS